MYRVVLAAALATHATSCTGELPPPSGPEDAATTDARPADARGLTWVDAPPGTGNNLPCKDPATPPGDGHHNPGKSCFQSCHNHGFTLAGTLYTNATGNSAFVGATITVTDAANKSLELITHQNGNFYTRDAITFPVLVIASSCPSAVRMQASAPSGNCNSCHVGGTNDQMHLP